METGGSFRINMFRNTELVKRIDENKPQNCIQAGLNSIQGSIQDSLDSSQGDLSAIQGSTENSLSVICDSSQTSLDVIQDMMIDLTNTDKELLKLITSNISLSQVEMAKILK